VYPSAALKHQTASDCSTSAHIPYIQKSRCPAIFSAYIEESYTRVRERMNTTAGVSANLLLSHTTYDEHLPSINTP
jgi:hypothetical protein